MKKNFVCWCNSCHAHPLVITRVLNGLTCRYDKYYSVCHFCKGTGILHDKKTAKKIYKMRRGMRKTWIL